MYLGKSSEIFGLLPPENLSPLVMVFDVREILTVVAYLLLFSRS